MVNQNTVKIFFLIWTLQRTIFNAVQLIQNVDTCAIPKKYELVTLGRTMPIFVAKEDFARGKKDNK